jgi:putative ABC transport system permease protein
LEKWPDCIRGILQGFVNHSQSINPFRYNLPIRPQFSDAAARNPEAIHALLGKAEKVWHETFPNEIFKYTFFDETIAALYSNERHLSNLLELAMVIAILISCMGLLGLASFAAQQRSKEMSIRKVLGASGGRIVALLTGSFLWPVALAFAIAVPIAWYFMNQWLQSFVYRTTIPW